MCAPMCASSLAGSISLLSVAQEGAMPLFGTKKNPKQEVTDGPGPGDRHPGLTRGCSFQKRQAEL